MVENDTERCATKDEVIGDYKIQLEEGTYKMVRHLRFKKFLNKETTSGDEEANHENSMDD